MRRVDQWDGIVGAKGAFALGDKHKWVVPYYVDIGTGDSDVTWQAELGVGYRLVGEMSQLSGDTSTMT